MPLVRLQKYIAECGIASRRAAEELITDGKVQVNGRIVTELGTKVDPDRDLVRVRNKTVKPAEKGILLFYKPRAVVSTLSDPEGRPCVADYLTKNYESYFPVGRLDFDSTGLIVITNDGELAQRLLHPRYGYPRIYHVRVEGHLPEATLQKLINGVRLADGMARIEDGFYLRNEEKSTWVQVTIREGRNRIIRRMMDKIGYPVMKLRRIAIGPFKIGKLKPGGMRRLPEREYRFLREKVMRETEGKESAPPPRERRRER